MILSLLAYEYTPFEYEVDYTPLWIVLGIDLVLIALFPLIVKLLTKAIIKLIAWYKNRKKQRREAKREKLEGKRRKAQERSCKRGYGKTLQTVITYTELMDSASHSYGAQPVIYRQTKWMQQKQFTQYGLQFRGTSGVYILYNTQRQKYYVGQTTDLYRRVQEHFKNHGSPDVYTDFWNGEEFLVSLIALSDTTYRDLDALERDIIAFYHAYDLGYNRTRGNNVCNEDGECALGRFG